MIKLENSIKNGLASPVKAVRLHLTNVTGLGAAQLLRSLLPALERLKGYRLEKIYLPSRGELSHHKSSNDETTLIHYKRYLPNSISRVFECTLLGGRFDGAAPLLVFGDIPIRCEAKQTVFVQTPLLARRANFDRYYDTVKFWIARWLFRLNMRFVSAFIVQTDDMKSSLIETYPEIKGRVHVIAQPAPRWLLESKLKRTRADVRTDKKLRLFYPAAFYPHKNHRLLAELQADHATAWPISELLLTIPENRNPNPAIPWVRCVDRLAPDEVLKTYKLTDALLFLSMAESYGFPLVEAMWIGLPIICPDLPYARVLCGDQAIYFTHDSVDSLRSAVDELGKRINSGWWPDWSGNLEKIPRTWEDVAVEMLKIATSVAPNK